MTSDVLERQYLSMKPPSTVPGQDRLGTNYVTISIGGNDSGFGDVIKQCAKPWPTTCWGDIDKAQAFIRKDLPGRLSQVYSTIRRHVPNAYVVVFGYPRLFAEQECTGAARISVGEQRRLNDSADVLRDVTRAQVTAAGRGFTFVDPTSAFTGHAVCAGDEEWLNGVSNPTSESFHPNRSGYRDGYLPLIRAAIRSSP